MLVYRNLPNGYLRCKKHDALAIGTGHSLWPMVTCYYMLTTHIEWHSIAAIWDKLNSCEPLEMPPVQCLWTEMR